ncbi:kinase-like domain-containing protein [Xylaria acuta]|nr:kinase-like domain-containing protein [Xylaria acuta]
MPFPNALFALEPINDRAHEVLRSPRNKRFRSALGNGDPVLDIGHVRSKSANSNTLATLGRDGDIVLEGGSISKIHCSFEINPDTNVVMFYDRSHTQTSQVYGETAFPFEYGRPRKVVVFGGINDIIGIGGVSRDLIQFRLKWYQDPIETTEKAKERRGFALEENTHLAETIDESETAPVSQRETRLHTAGARQLPIRWAQMGCLGSGSYGDVYKAIDLDHGKLMAVKRLKVSKTGVSSERLKTAWLREAKILSTMNHPHIVEYISSQGWDKGAVEIFMPLKDGNLTSLMQSQNLLIPAKDIIRLACHQILQAIDFLAIQMVVHRDIKPDNILYSIASNQYHFQLSDFGLSNHQYMAETTVGTWYYMAPELNQHGITTHKADVWSLFVTLLWTSGNKDFRNLQKTQKGGMQGIYNTIFAIGLHERLLGDMREMAALNPEARASAAQMLVKCYGGQGLTTPLCQIPPLPLQTQFQTPAIGHQNPATIYQTPARARQAPATVYQAAPRVSPGASPTDYQTLPIDYQAPQIIHEALPPAHQAPPEAHPATITRQATSRQAKGRRAATREATATSQPPVPPHLGPRRNTNPQTPRRLAPKPSRANTLGNTFTRPNFPGAQPPAGFEYP